MSTPSDGDAGAKQEAALAEAQAELDRQEELDEAPLDQLGEKEAHLLGGLYTGPDRKWREHMQSVDAAVPAGEAQLAARVGQGEEAALLKDSDEAKADASVVAAAGGPAELAQDSSGLEAEIDRDLDAAMKEFIELNADSQAARQAERDHDSASAHAAAAAAQGLLAEESSALADADQALAKLESEMRAAGEQPPQHQD
ncbi:MAG: hypothetical protein ACLPYW_15690 [Acidimicrobiales bacterium]